jgi:phosphoribosylamine--glycine ligase
MNVLLIGSGGREHALSWKLSGSKELEKLFILPGNAGTSQHGENVNINPLDFEAIGKFAIDNKIDTMIVGPEEPLVKGIHDYFAANKDLKDIFVIGPKKEGARLEGSKDFSKAFMQRNNIPTAKYQSFTRENFEDAKEFLDSMAPPYVLKADGLAAGKGVVILDDKEKAIRELDEMFSGKFGDASKKVVIEEFLEGVELSVFVLTDGKSYLTLPEAKDYKRIGEGDTGLNTGGMGAVSPVPFATPEFMEKIDKRIIKPTIDGLYNEKIPYSGFIFFGLINVNGDPRVIEYNVRMGDPECQVVMPRLSSDLGEIIKSMKEGNLGDYKAKYNKEPVSTVVLVSGGYPGPYKKGKEITGELHGDDAIVFHAGTKTENGKLLTNGGRVIAVSGTGKNVKEALNSSYTKAGKIYFEGKTLRKDIGFDLFKMQ